MSRFSEAPETSRFTEAPSSRFTESDEPQRQQARFTEGGDSSRARFSESGSAPSRFTEGGDAEQRSSSTQEPTLEEGENIAKLEETLNTYLAQQKQVQQLIELDPNNDELTKIQGDVEEGIRITMAKIDKCKRDEAIANERSFVPGAYAEAQFEDGLWYTVRIFEVREATPVTPIAPASPKTWRVLSIGYSNQFDVTLDRLRPWRPPVHIKKGDEVEAVNPANGLFFAAIIDRVTDQNTVWVSFKQSRNLEEVPLTHIRVTKSKAIKRPRKEPDQNKVVLTKEAEEARERKRKKMQKRQDRVNELNQVQESQRSSWKHFQSHVKQTQKVNRRTSVAKGGSIFASPDTIEGKVGVTGSGQGMTKDKTFQPVIAQQK
eukprot:Sspe_Gene.46335::Locus_23138_Transcript_1_1_Confidence_1.000_Length_1192::g.46335::m.46335/K12839/SMNDC1, SPF30; survival of motor neuron-related-splicing factor 30